jgi:deazaflavin-dependent oxidoreductase (nitroreductase family)
MQGMLRKRVFQVCLCGLVVAWTTVSAAAAGAGETQAVNLRDSPAKATTPFNVKVVEDFRANAGKVGGRFANSRLLLLHTTGAKSGQPRLTPLVYLTDGDRLVVIASNGGAAKHPAWYHNLVANPKVGVEVGAEQFYARATVAPEPERTTLFDTMAAKSPAFAAYQQKAAPRVIPVILLTRMP